MRSPEGAIHRFAPGALCLEFLTTGGPGPPPRAARPRRPRP
ncbi:hypothetical protein [Sphaerisporangium album]|nr:hypothetical protein [Sphaerisporangium album]